MDHINSTYLFTQTLTMFNLEVNQIGDQGAHYLSEVLKHNSVGHSLTVIRLNSIYSHLFRHLLDCFCVLMKSEVKVQHISVTH